MPDLDLIPNLEELDLHGCKNLERAHESVAYHAKLQMLNLKECSSLHHLPNVLQSKNLQLLNLTGCSKLQRFPDIPDKIEGLQELYLKGTSIKELPASIENLVSLENLSLINCKKLASLPSNIYKLPNLESLILTGCSKLIKFPKEEDFSDLRSKTGFPKLRILRLGGCNLLQAEFPENHSCFPKLLFLDVSECQQLQEIGKIPKQLRGLLAMNCDSKCESLSKILSDVYSLFHALVSHKQFGLRFFRHILLLGGEMPKWLLPNKEGYISFMASKDLYKKFLAIAMCIVFRVREGSRNVRFNICSYNDGRIQSCYVDRSCPLHSDHVWFCCVEMEDLWQVDPFSPNDLSSFRLGIRVSGGAIVKKCGFRLICKPLDDDLEALYQDDQLLDPGLLYEIWHDNKETTTEEESSADLSIQRWLDHEDNNRAISEEIRASETEDTCIPLYEDIMADFSVEKYRYSGSSHSYGDILPEGDMLEEFVLVEGSNISFMVSQDFYDKFLGLALCVVFNVEDGEKEIFFNIVPQVNGQRRNVLSGSLGSFVSNQMWIQYLKPNVLWGVLEGEVDFLEFDEDYLQFSLTLIVSGGTMEKLGYVLRCKQLDDDMKVALEDNQLVDTASIYEMKWIDFFRKFLPRRFEEMEVKE